MARRAAARLAAVLAVASPALAAASDAGQFPQTVSVNFQPGDDQTLVVSTTFGLLVSADDGESFRWVCETAVGYGGTYIPRYAVAADGAIYATTFEGLRVSRDGGCTFLGVDGEIGGRFIEDVEVAADGRVWATSASGIDLNDVYVSSDGQTFVAAGLEHPGARWQQILAAPSSPVRLYLTGLEAADSGGAAPLLYRSDDGGESWTQIDTGDSLPPTAIRFVLEGISPADPDVAFLRVVAAEGDSGLYRTADAGETFEAVLTVSADAATFSLAISVDGSEVVAGTANPCDDDPLDANKGCVSISSNGGVTWEPAATQPRLECLGVRLADGAVFACGADGDPDFFSLGRSADAASWNKVFRFAEVAGPLECAEPSAQEACVEDEWPMLCLQLGACTGEDPDPDPDPDPPDGGCCSTSGGASAASLLLLLLVPLAWRRRQGGRLP